MTFQELCLKEPSSQKKEFAEKVLRAIVPPTSPEPEIVDMPLLPNEILVKKYCTNFRFDFRFEYLMILLF